jgi:hypothetical protein
LDLEQAARTFYNDQSGMQIYENESIQIAVVFSAFNILEEPDDEIENNSETVSAWLLFNVK